MESPSTNRQKQAETQTPHTSTFLSQMHRFQIRETFGCAAVSVWSLSFIPFSNAGHATFNLSSCSCEMPGRVPNWRNQFAELLGILNLAKTFFEPCTLNNYLVLRFTMAYTLAPTLSEKFFNISTISSLENNLTGRFNASNLDGIEIILWRHQPFVCIFCLCSSWQLVFSDGFSQTQKSVRPDSNKNSTEPCVKVLIIVHVGGDIVVEGDLTMEPILAPLWRIF